MGMGAIQRSFHIPQNLVKLGWDVTVYTPHPPSGYIRDLSLLENHNLNIVRVPCPDALHLLPGRVISPGRGRRDYLSFPDNKVPWLPFLKKNMKTTDVVVTTCPPFSLLLFGLSLKVTPWIIDLRDPWVGGYLGEYRFGWEEKLAEVMERRSIQRASAAVTVTENHREMLIKNYPGYSEKIYTVRNGYLEEEFRDAVEETEEKKIVITYMGTFNIHHKPDLIFLGLKKLLKERPELNERILFKHIGHADKKIIEESKESTGFDRYYCTGYLPHREALNELMKSDILILTGEYGEEDINLIPGKIYEYLRSGIPIVAVTDNREIEELIDGVGIRCDFDEDSVCRAILDIMENSEEYHSIVNFKDYSWEKLSEDYSRILWSVL